MKLTLHVRVKDKHAATLSVMARDVNFIWNPRPSWLLREAARVVMPCGRIGMLHVAVPFAPPGCRLVTVYGVSTGVGFRIRAFTIYERAQAGLFGADGDQ
jgi:hypothetical protein